MDIVDNCAPFVLNMTLEYSPEDTESLLGFKPQSGTNYYGLYDFPDKRYYYNIMRGMGTLIVNILTRSIIDTALSRVPCERSEQNTDPNTRSINRSPYNSYIKYLTIIHERSNRQHFPANTNPLTRIEQSHEKEISQRLPPISYGKHPTQNAKV